MWIHGDLHPANLLLVDDQLASVIDFGDITCGDPATDLSVMWMLLPADQRETLFTAAGRNRANRPTSRCGNARVAGRWQSGGCRRARPGRQPLTELGRIAIAAALEERPT
jgi:aminoglycoside phosphotransferase (APT) family kinase protein